MLGSKKETSTTIQINRMGGNAKNSCRMIIWKAQTVIIADSGKLTAVLGSAEGSHGRVPRLPKAQIQAHASVAAAQRICRSRPSDDWDASPTLPVCLLSTKAAVATHSQNNRPPSPTNGANKETHHYTGRASTSSQHGAHGHIAVARLLYLLVAISRLLATH
eukprot:GHVT01066637.1.p1 GENE.GHVT01066637.1~~GHVT01066637.1.p1  ORF type:complete len:162 (-),score=11.16 GHVT01066637.1:604-1089(-)